MVKIHSHAMKRMLERGITEEEIMGTVLDGESLKAKLGRRAFRRNFVYNDVWLGKSYTTKQVEVVAVHEGADWIVITAIARYF